jgi:Dolichyl-phosphate-mannose-protein mannosyltransferase
MLARNLRLAIYALLAAIVYLPGLGRPALWEPDEGRYAEIAREMVVSGDYVTPRDDYELYFEKPPLVYWAEAASIHIFGVNEFAVRLPAALFSIGQVVFTAAMAETMLGAATGFFAALVLALSPLFFGFARFATLDPALAFFLTGALGAFYFAARDDSFSRPSSRRWMLISAAMLALGTLAKGPVALLLGGAIPLAWIAVERRLRQIAQMPLIWCGIIYAAIVVPWFILIEARNPGFLNFFFIHEHLERYVSSNEHGWGPWFFIPIVIGGMWPWIFFVPPGWSAMRSGDQIAARRSPASFLARQLHPARASAACDRRRIRPRTNTNPRRPQPPPSSRRRCTRESFARGSSLRIFRACTGSVESRTRLRRIADWRRSNRRRDCDVLARAQRAASFVCDRRARPCDARDSPACSSRARRRVLDFHLSRPGQRGSAIPDRRLHVGLVSSLCPIAPVLHARSRGPRRVLGRAFRG